MIIVPLVFFAAFVFTAAPAGAQDCTVAQDLERIDIGDAVMAVERRLRQVNARADSQELRLLALAEPARAGVPPRPAAPEPLGVELSDDDKALIACDDAFDAAAIDLRNRIDAANAALDRFAAAVAARETALTAAEDAPPAAEAPPAAAEAPPAAEDAPPGGEAAADPSPSVAADRREPMPDPENPSLFRRVITLPGAALHAEAGGPPGAELPTFGVLYVFDESSANGEGWLEIGAALRSGGEGWVRAESTLDWSSMLVMQFAPRGRRSDVLFFKDRVTLSDIVNSPFYEADAAEIYQRLSAEREKLAADPSHEPQWDRALVAVEPRTGVTFRNDPYLLPILDWRDEAFDGAIDTVLLQVAAVPARATAVADRDTDSFQSDPGARAAEDGEFRVGVAFVMDTTISMAPFIERTYQTVEQFYEAFQSFETSAFVSFGLVGFRDNVERSPEGLDYVTRIFQPLDPEAAPRQVLTNMRRMTEATVPTRGFEEDGFAGIMTALEGMDWSPYDVKLVIFVTDASSRGGGDPLAADPGLNARAVAEIARNEGVVIVPIHLATPANRQAGDLEIAAGQYRDLAATGDLAVDKYFQIEAEDAEVFSATVRRAAEEIVAALLAANAGLMVPGETLEPVPSTASEDPGDRMAAVVANEIFRAQLESLAEVGDGDAPTFLAGWAADLDLTDPDRRTLEVSVFLTRNQLSTLDRRLDIITEAFRTAEDDPGAFFDKLQVLAAEMSTDPGAAIPDDREAVATLLPAFLSNLPYRSDVLRLDREYWTSLSSSARDAFIENIEAKQRIYDETFSQTDLWRDFGAEDPGLQATPIRLTNLP